MRRSKITLLLPALMMLGLVPAGEAQTGKNVPVKNSQEAAAEAAKVLEKAKAGSAEELARRAAEEAQFLRTRQFAEKTAADKPAVPSFAEQSERSASEARLKAAMKQVSPQGRSILAQSAAAPPMRAPTETPGSLSVSADARPQPVKPTPINPPKTGAPPEHTTIDCQGAAFFDSKQGMGVFTDDVVVVHPQFHITCDVLEVYMKKDKKEPDKKAGVADGVLVTPPGKTASQLLAEGASSTPATAPDPAPEDSGIETAIAKGRKVVINKKSETGELQIGICRHATYIGASGDIVMREYPQVQRGTRTVRGTAPSTILTLKQNGELVTSGPTAVDIIQEDPKKAPQAGATGAPAAVLTPKPAGGQR